MQEGSVTLLEQVSPLANGGNGTTQGDDAPSHVSFENGSPL
jgi:hypothetical protein